MYDDMGAVVAQSVIAPQVAQMVGRGWRVESATPWQTNLVRGRRPNHILHLLLSIVTFGLWLPIWLIVGLTAREVRCSLYVRADGSPGSSVADNASRRMDAGGMVIAGAVIGLAIFMVWRMFS